MLELCRVCREVVAEDLKSHIYIHLGPTKVNESS